MTATSGHLLVLTVALGTLGCSNEVTDTEGRTYEFECKAGDCSLFEKDVEEEKKVAYLAKTEGRVLQVCPADKPGFNCRPVTCEPSTPCSQLGGASFTCDKKLCQAPDRELTPADKLALCLAETGEWKRTPKQLERLTLSRACIGDCVLPAACLGI